MSILFTGSEDIDWLSKTGSVNTTSNYLRSAYSRCSMYCSISGQYVLSQEWTDASEVWLSAQCCNPVGVNATTGMIMFYRGGVEVFRIRAGASTYGLFEIYQSSTVRAAASSGAILTGLFKIDVHYLKSVNGYVRVYKDGASSPWFSYSGDTSAWGDIDQVSLGGGGSYWSEVIVTDTEDTRTWSLRALGPSGAGNANGWDGGTYADVDEVGLDVGDVMYSGTANQEATLAAADMPAGQFTVRQVRVHAYAARGTSGPANLALGVRTGGANYYGSNKSLDLGWKCLQEAWDINPASSQGWTSADVNALELALKSVT